MVVVVDGIDGMLANETQLELPTFVSLSFQIISKLYGAFIQ